MTNKQKILICDDEQGIRESFKLILGNQYDLILTSCGDECLKSLSVQNDIKLVLMDIKIPKQNGLEIMKNIKEKYPHVKIIVVTGYSSSEIAQEASKIGAADYIVKPFESKDILRKVKSIMN